VPAGQRAGRARRRSEAQPTGRICSGRCAVYRGGFLEPLHPAFPHPSTPRGGTPQGGVL